MLIGLIGVLLPVPEGIVIGFAAGFLLSARTVAFATFITRALFLCKLQKFFFFSGVSNTVSRTILNHCSSEVQTLSRYAFCTAH